MRCLLAYLHLFRPFECPYYRESKKCLEDVKHIAYYCLHINDERGELVGTLENTLKTLLLGSARTGMRLAYKLDVIKGLHVGVP